MCRFRIRVLLGVKFPERTYQPTSSCQSWVVEIIYLKVWWFKDSRKNLPITLVCVNDAIYGYSSHWQNNNYPSAIKEDVTRVIFSLTSLNHCGLVKPYVDKDRGKARLPYQWPLLLTWFNFNPSSDKQSHAQLRVWWNYLSIPKLQRLHRWSVGIDK